jgi:hypothetical protein
MTCNKQCLWSGTAAAEGEEEEKHSRRQRQEWGKSWKLVLLTNMPYQPQPLLLLLLLFDFPVADPDSRVARGGGDLPADRAVCQVLLLMLLLLLLLLLRVPSPLQISIPAWPGVVATFLLTAVFATLTTATATAAAAAAAARRLLQILILAWPGCGCHFFADRGVQYQLLPLLLLLLDGCCRSSLLRGQGWW